MADQIIGEPGTLSRALAEPTVHVRHRWITGLSLASLGMWMASLTPLQVLIPIQLQDITPRHKIVALAVVSGLGDIASGLATPLAGALSDRTTHRFPLGWLRGRRHRWTLSMALLAAVSLAVLARQASVAGVAVLWILFCAFQNGEYASLSAAIPDHVPVRQRATVAGWVGMPQALGLVIGTVLVVDVFTKLISGYDTLAVLLAVLTLPFVLLTPDHALEVKDRPTFSWRQLARSYWLSPRRYPDFAWAWVTRFLASLAIAMGTLYLLYFLRDQVHYSRLFPGKTAKDGLLILIVIYTVCVVITAVVGGIISDRIGKRRSARPSCSARASAPTSRLTRPSSPRCCPPPGTGPRTSASLTSPSCARPRSALCSRRRSSRSVAIRRYSPRRPSWQQRVPSSYGRSRVSPEQGRARHGSQGG